MRLLTSLLPLLSPREALLAGAKAGKIASAEIAAVRSCAETQFHYCHGGRMVILFGPRAQFQPEAFRAAGIADRRQIPNRGVEAIFTLAAAKRKNPNDTAEPCPDAAYLRKTEMFRSALRTGNKSHFQTRGQTETLSKLDAIARLT